MYKISVVTVTYNCRDTVEETIKSVTNQSYDNMEYIIIDGGSNDGTIEIIEKYSNRISKIVSEKDNGIFDAMNKALNYADGDYIIFINSGDLFAEEDTVEKVFCHYTGEADLIYGDVYYKNDFGLRLSKCKAIYGEKITKYKLVFKGQGISHQSLFTKTKELKRVRFDLRFPIGADYLSTYQVYLNGNGEIVYVGFPISIFDANNQGMSHKDSFMREIYDERKEMFSYSNTVVYHISLYNKKTVYWLKKWAFAKCPKITGKIRRRSYKNEQ